MIICARHLAWIQETYYPEDIPTVVSLCRDLLKERLSARKVNPRYYEGLNPMGCFVCMESEEILIDAFEILRAESEAAEQEAVEDESGHG